jgi:hypothetical protein
VEEHYMVFNVTGNVTFHKNITVLYPWTTYMFCIAAQTTSGKGAEICKEQQTYPVIIPFGLHGSSQYNVTDVELTLRMSTDSGCSGTEITEWSAKIYYTLIIVPHRASNTEN